jgi:hypothetical protein
MTDKQLYQQKKMAQLNEWKADLIKLKAKASRLDAEAQLEMHKHLRTLGSVIDENKSLLSQLSDASGEAWESVKHGVEAAWESLRASIHEATAKYKA